MLLGEILIQKYEVDSSDVEKALQFQAKFGGMLGSILVNMGTISEETLVAAVSEQLNLRMLKDFDRSELNFSDRLIEDGINVSFLLDRKWLPLKEEDGRVTFFSVNSLDYEATQYLEDQGVQWDVCMVTPSEFRGLENEYQLAMEAEQIESLKLSDLMEGEIDKLRELATEAPIVNLVNSLISRGVNAGASDLHFEPYKDMYRVRFRIDGILHDIDFLPAKLQVPVSSRVKILSGMDIAERRRPQDGQISVKISSREVDIRVSTLPLASGESVVLRFLLKDTMDYKLGSLGLEPDLVRLLWEDLSKSSGVILLTGPTGSGKTTTLYSCLNKINKEEIKIITVEDPVEYQLEGINQIQIQPEIGYDFPAALRSILRQDPDVIMIGEIRDAETARIAMQSSLTGHLVFSTVHTNNAPSAYSRLIDLGVEEYLINTSLVSVIAQRLVRKICPDCKASRILDKTVIEANRLDVLAEKFNLDLSGLVRAKGCPACNHTGFKGRVGIVEYLRCTEKIKEIPKNAGFSQKAERYMSQSGIRNLAEDGFLKALKGVTTIEEVLRVCS